MRPKRSILWRDYLKIPLPPRRPKIGLDSRLGKDIAITFSDLEPVRSNVLRSIERDGITIDHAYLQRCFIPWARIYHISWEKEEE